MKYKLSKGFSLGVKYILILLMCFIIILPIFIFMLASLKTSMEFARSTLFQLPETFNTENYRQVFVKGHLLTAYKNTCILLMGGGMAEYCSWHHAGICAWTVQISGQKSYHCNDNGS